MPPEAATMEAPTVTGPVTIDPDRIRAELATLEKANELRFYWKGMVTKLANKGVPEDHPVTLAVAKASQEAEGAASKIKDYRKAVQVLDSLSGFFNDPEEDQEDEDLEDEDPE